MTSCWKRHLPSALQLISASSTNTSLQSAEPFSDCSVFSIPRHSSSRPTPSYIFLTSVSRDNFQRYPSQRNLWGLQISQYLASEFYLPSTRVQRTVVYLNQLYSPRFTGVAIQIVLFFKIRSIDFFQTFGQKSKLI